MTLFPTQPNIPSPTTAARPVAVPAPGVSAPLGADDAKRARILADAIRARFAQTLVGQDNLRESLIVTLVAGGHILIESVPGLAKTTAAQTLATCVSGSFKRVQCTPDLMPSDLVGTQVFDFASQKFTTQIGPIHANFVLLDEINRSNAKTQSAMLEAMAESATTIGGQRIALPKPFMVIATENPIEEEGTFNLPEAQMDRFMMKAVMTYPSPDEEARMLAMLTIALTRIGQAKALLSGRDYVVPEDLKAFAHEVLRHRIMLTFEALADGVVSDQIVDKIVETVPVP